MWYWISLATLLVLTMFFATRDAAIGFALLTFGLGYVVVLICTNLLPLFLALLPIKILPDAFRIVGIILGIFAYACYLFVPSYLAHKRADELVASAALDDIATASLPRDIRSFELNYRQEATSDICTIACKALIGSGDADWVRVTYKDGISHTFVRDTREGGCSDNCVTVAQDTGLPADLTLTQSVSPAKGLKASFPDSVGLRVLDITRMDAFLAGGSASQPIYRKNSVRYHVMQAPTIITPQLTGAGSDGYEFAWGQSSGADVAHLTTLQDLGFAKVTTPTATPYVPKATPTPLERSAAVLALDSDRETFSMSEQRAIRQYMDRVRWHDPFPAAELEMIERIIKDQRFDEHILLSGILGKNQDFRMRILPSLFDRFEQAATTKTQLYFSVVNALRFDYAADELNPYFDRYVRIVETSDPVDKATASLVGSFGHDPTTLYRVILRNVGNDLRVAKIAVCYADPRWRDAMMPDLISAFAQKFASGEADRLGETVSKIAYMASTMGYLSEIEPLLRSKNFGDDRFWDRIAQYDGQPDLFMKAC